MATVTLRPNADGDVLQWEVASGDHYAYVDEVVNEGDGSVVNQTNTGATEDDLYNIGTDAVLEGATINSVTVYISARYVSTGSGSNPSAPTITQIVRISGTTYAAASADTLGSSYADTSNAWTTSPATSAAWTKAEIDALQVGGRGRANAGGGSKVFYPRMTQVWVVVDYTEAGSGVSGTATITLDGLTPTAAAISPIVATLDKAIDGITLSAAGISSITAQAEITLDDLTASGAATSDITAQAEIVLEDLTSSAAGTSEVSGAAGITLADLTISAAGEGPASTAIIDIDHETGDLSQYTSTVTDSGDLSVVADAALAESGYGLQCVTDDSTAIYGRKNLSSPNSSNVFRARFYFDPNTFANTVGAQQYIFYLNNSSSAAFGYVWMRLSSGNYQIAAAIVTDAPANSATSYYTITNEPHYIEVEWNKASSADANDASVQLWIDGVSQELKSGIDSYTRWSTGLDHVLFGMGYSGGGTLSGTFYLDELVVNDTGDEIGPVEATGVNGIAAITLDGLTINAAGTSTITAAAQITLDALTLTGAGVSTVEAEAAITLADVTLTGAAASTIVASAEIALGGLTLTATGGSGVNASAAIVLDALTLTGAGVAPINAVADIALDGVTLSGAGVSPITAQAAITLDDITLVASTGAGINASAEIQLDDLTASATGAALIDAGAEITLADMTCASAAVSAITAQAGILLDGLTVIGAATLEVTGELLVTLAVLTLYATGSIPATGTGGRPVNYVGGRGNLSAGGDNVHHVQGRAVLSSGNRCTLYVSELETEEL